MSSESSARGGSRERQRAVGGTMGAAARVIAANQFFADFEKVGRKPPQGGG